MNHLGILVEMRILPQRVWGGVESEGLHLKDPYVALLLEEASMGEPVPQRQAPQNGRQASGSHGSPEKTRWWSRRDQIRPLPAKYQGKHRGKDCFELQAIEKQKIQEKVLYSPVCPKTGHKSASGRNPAPSPTEKGKVAPNAQAECWPHHPRDSTTDLTQPRSSAGAHGYRHSHDSAPRKRRTLLLCLVISL